MKKYLTYIAIFFAIILIIDFAWGKAFDYLSANARSGDMQTRNYLVNTATPEILIMGSSRAHHHYNDKQMTDSLGVAVYNAGVDGNGIISMYGLFKLITKRHIPKVIIYDVEPAFDIIEYSGDDNDRRYLQLLKPFFHDDDIASIFAAVGWQEKIKNHSGLFRNNTDFLNIAKNYISSAPVPSFGYIPVNGSMTEYNKPAKVDITSVDSLKIKYLNQLACDASRLGIRLIFVSSPKYGDSSDSSYFFIINELCAEYGTEFWDYNTIPVFQKFEYFKEPMHLNDAGAKVFTDTMITEIKNKDYAYTIAN